MNRLWKGRFRWGRLLLVWLVFLLLAGALFAERSGVQYTAAHVQIGALDHALTKEEALAGQAPVCLLLCDSRQVSVAEAKEQLEQILQDMKVPAEAADLADTAFCYYHFSVTKQSRVKVKTAEGLLDMLF